MLLYVIRHGETDGNKGGVLQGRLDMPLNETGRELAVITGKALSKVHFDMVITSPLKRAAQTAALLMENNTVSGDVPVYRDERLLEISFGDWEGKKMRGKDAMIPQDRFREFYEHPFTFQSGKGGESIPHLIERTGSLYRELTERKELQDKTILISTHGCAMRAFLNHVYPDKENYWHGKVPDNCAVNVVLVENGVGRLIEDDVIYYDKGLCVNYFNKNN